MSHMKKIFTLLLLLMLTICTFSVPQQSAQVLQQGFNHQDNESNNNGNDGNKLNNKDNEQYQVSDCLNDVNVTYTKKQFNLTACSILTTSSQLSINMTYTVINDAAGAKANKIAHSAGHYNIYSQMVVNYEKNETFHDVNHHLGEVVVSNQNILLDPIHFVSGTQYYWISSLCLMTGGICVSTHLSLIPFKKGPSNKLQIQ